MVGTDELVENISELKAQKERIEAQYKKAMD